MRQTRKKFTRMLAFGCLAPAPITIFMGAEPALAVFNSLALYCALSILFNEVNEGCDD